jgi:hypothetical protein
MTYDTALEIAPCRRLRLGVAGAMTRFAYLRDRLFLTACAAYAVNRLWLKHTLPGWFLHSYFNDLLLIPAALPLVLWIQRRFVAYAPSARILVDRVFHPVHPESLKTLPARPREQWRD